MLFRAPIVLSPTPRNVAPVFNVADYGATGDGATDDTAAIQAALAACAAANGGRVHIPAGSYKLASSLTVASGALVTGDGEASRLFRDTNVAAFDFLVGVGVQDVTIERVAFDGVAKLGITVPANRYSAIRIWGGVGDDASARVTVRGCSFRSFTAGEFQAEGNRGVITLSDVSDALIDGNLFADNRATCVLYDDADHVRVVNNQCLGEQAPFDPAYVQAFGSFVSGRAQGVTVSGNRIVETGFTSINVSGDGIVVSGNVIREPKLSCVTLNEGSATATSVVVSGNVLDSPGLDGVSVFNVDGAVITGNTINAADTSGNAGVRFYPGVHGAPAGRVVVGENLFTDCHVAVRVSAGADVVLRGNVFRDGLSTAVLVANATDAPSVVDIVGCVFEDHGSYGIESTGTTTQQTVRVNGCSFFTSDIETKMMTGIMSSGALSAVVVGVNTFATAYDTSVVETTFAGRLGKALCRISSGTISAAKVLSGLPA